MRIAFFDDVAGARRRGAVGAATPAVISPTMGHQVTVVCAVAFAALPARCLAAGIDVFSYLRMYGIPVYEPVFEALRRRDIDVLYCTVIGMFREAQRASTLVDRLNRGSPSPAGGPGAEDRPATDART